jgi:acetyl esterase/lipase
VTSSEDILTLPPPKADARVAYGADENQFIDLRLPGEKPPHALALFIHGGFWRSRYNLAYAGHWCAALTAQGFATANVEYRRVGNPGGGWPGSFADVRGAYQFLMQNSRRYGFDAGRVAAVGHSAGSQLALCLAAHEALAAAISLAGVVDLQQAYALHLSNDAVVEFLGGTPSQVKDHYQEADPMKIPIKTKQWLVHGSADDIVPPAFSRDYVKAKDARMEHAELVEIAGAGHFDLVDPRSAAWKEVERVVKNALG